MKRLALFTATLLATSMAHADALKPGYVACVTEAALDKAAQNERMMGYMLKKGECALTSRLAHLDTTVDRVSWTSTQVTVWYGDTPLTLFTISKAVER